MTFALSAKTKHPVPKTDRAAHTLVGHEPPLTLSENSRAALKQGSVSWRWLAGAFVTGICGAGLIGGALMTSVEGAIHFAQPMTSWRVAQTPDVDLGLGDRNSSTAKSDKLDLAREMEISRKVIQTTAERTVGGKTFISIRPYELVTIPIATTATDIANDLPPFNPLKIFAAGGLFSDDDADVEPVKTDANDALEIETVSFAEAGAVLFHDTEALSPQDIDAAVRAAAPFEFDAATAFVSPTVPAINTESVAFAGIGAIGDASTAQETVFTKNESVVTKAPSDPVVETAESTQVVTVNRGDTLSSLLGEAGVSPSEARVIAETLRAVFDPSRLKPGQQIHLAVNAEATDDKPQLVQMSLFDDGAHLASVRQSAEDGRFVALDSSAEVVRPVLTATAAPKSGNRASIYKGLYESGIRHNIPNEVLNRIVQVHSYDVDFKRAVQTGDNFTAFFELPDESGTPPDPLPLYISMTVRGDGRGFYKFRTPDDGVIDYYDAEGRSAKKFLIRKPMNGGRFRSGFGMRRHPILRYRRMHKGVDWSAPRGTPIVAAGNGTVVEAKWKSGYGKWVKLRHANGYETNYAHMTRHAKGIAAGRKVRQGQVIGYVGSTGLSTGPHLHYEVEVNGRHVDPLRIRLPRGRVLQADMLAAFEREKARIDALMAKPPAQSTLARRDTNDTRQFANQ